MRTRKGVKMKMTSQKKNSLHEARRGSMYEGCDVQLSCSSDRGGGLVHADQKDRTSFLL